MRISVSCLVILGVYTLNAKQSCPGTVYCSEEIGAINVVQSPRRHSYGCLQSSAI